MLLSPEIIGAVHVQLQEPTPNFFNLVIGFVGGLAAVAGAVTVALPRFEALWQSIGTLRARVTAHDQQLSNGGLEAYIDKRISEHVAGVAAPPLATTDTGVSLTQETFNGLMDAYFASKRPGPVSPPPGSGGGN
jgi:hypothetical protein